LATAFASLDSRPGLGDAATFDFFVVVLGRVRGFALGLSASAFGWVPKARLRTVVVGIPFGGLPGTVGVVGARRPNSVVVVTGTFVVDDACGNVGAFVVEVPVLVAKFPPLARFEFDSSSTTVDAGATEVVVVVGSGAATSKPA
jgi:hypothetical protein